MSFDDGVAECDGIDFKWMRGDNDSSSEEEDRNDREGPTLPVFSHHEKSWRARLRAIILRNPTARINISLVYISLKVLLCAVYVVRVSLDNPKEYACEGTFCNITDIDTESDGGFTSTNINWYVLLWVQRPTPLWIVEILLSLITLLKTIMLTVITGKGNFLVLFSSRFFFLELFCCVPLVVSALWPPVMQHLFFPTFLNCWLALMSLRNLLNDFHLAKQRFQTMSVTLSQQLWFLIATLCSLIFTSICGIQHIQRGSAERPLNLFEAVYFVIVTLSTVGYGDISPDIWLGQLFMIIMICIAFSFIPRQIEEIGSTWAQRKRMGGDYSKRSSAKNKHVVVIGSQFTTESVMSFLNEFFEHPKLENYTVILMSSEELDDSMQFILKDPKWTLRVLYIRGSALKDIDLKRCRIDEAEACFFLVNKKSSNIEKSDQHTVLRSWAVKDFAPNCAQYIQLHKASNKIYVKFAEHVVSEDEFKFALLANNCLYPGLSTLVTLILHTSRGHEGIWAPEQWQQIYGRHSGNEIYHIQLQRSVFFKEYEGKRFTFASADAHKKYGVNLIAVFDSTALEAQLQLNPGPDYIMKSYDYCFYMSLAKEENIKFSPKASTEEKKNASTSLMSESREKNIALIVKEMNKLIHETDGEQEDADEESVFSTITSSIGASLGKSICKTLEGEPLLPKSKTSSLGEDLPNDTSDSKQTESFDREHGAKAPSMIVQNMIDLGKDSFMIGPPPSMLNLETRRTLCHLHKEARSLCCLKWGETCCHCSYKVASDKRWDHQLVILSVRRACPGLYNFIVPLRSNYLNLVSLRPIILMFEEVPTNYFLQTIASFPLVFWMQGTLSNLDDLLVAGVNKAMHLVISHIETDPGGEENLSDAETIITVQKISRLFPHVNIITEVNEASNMRFMHFKAKDTYMLKIRKLEKKLKEQADMHLPYMFRLPFAAGQVFSSAMLDRLLYQTFVKGYLISFVRLLLGIDAEKDSGHLSSVRIRRATLTQFPTYGDLYQGLASTTGEIPIALYRTEKQNPTLLEGNFFGLRENLVLKKKHRTLRHMLHIPHHPRSRRNLRAARMSVAGFVDKDKHSNRHLEEMIQARMESLGLSRGSKPYVIEKSVQTLSYVIVNPSPARKLRSGDMIYVIQPSSMQAVPNKLNRRGGTLTKSLLRARHISINTAKHNNNGSADGYPADLSQSLADIHAASSLPTANGDNHKEFLTSSQVTWLDVNGDTTGQQDSMEDNAEENLTYMRPRCWSESNADKKTVAFAIDGHTADSVQA